MIRLLFILLLLPSLTWAQSAQVFHEDRTGGKAWYSPHPPGVQHGDPLFNGQPRMMRLGPLRVSGVHPVLFIPISFIGEPVQVPAGLAQQLVDFYSANSYGALQLQVTTVPVTLAKPAGCDYRTLGSRADQAVRAAKGSAALYLHIVYLHPSLPCGFSGVSTVGGAPSLSWINGVFALRVVAHEMGHGLGNVHSHALACGDQVVGVIGAGCASIEYGDEFDVMGSGSSDLNAAVKAKMGWLQPALEGPLAPFLTAPSAIRVDREGQAFWLESRPEGVIVHLEMSGAVYMLVMRSWAQPELPVNVPWTDPLTGTTLKYVGMDPAGAQITIDGAPQPAVVGDVSQTFTRLKTTDPPATVQVGDYTCRRLMGGTSALQILWRTTRLRSVVVLRPAFKEPFTLRCQVSDTLVTLSLNGGVKLVAPR